MVWACASCSGSNPDGTRFCGLCGTRREAASTPTPATEPVPAMVVDALRGLVLTPQQTRPGGGLREERRLVTALFADISGFSELTNRLDAEQLLEVIDPAIAALSNVVGRYDGLIEKFAGDALMALFGAPVAHDDDAARALHVALDMHTELARLVPTLPKEASGLRLHVGVNSGHGIGRVIGSEVRFDYGVLGDVVVLAQRLEASAPTGQTYVGDTTYELTRKDFEFEPLGELMVKGKDKPVRAWRLLGPKLRHRGVGRIEAGAILVGREPELQAVGEFATRLGQNGGGAAFVIGEAGVGKTALCEAVRRLPGPAQREWLDAHCLSYGAALAYWPIADLMRRLFDLGDTVTPATAETLRQALAALGLEDTLPFIGPLCGVEQVAPQGLTPQTFQTRLHESVIAVLRARAADRGLVLYVDDLQWADHSTVALLRDLHVAAADMPLLLLASARAEGEPFADELTAPRPDAALRLHLQPLGAEAVRDIAAAILGAPPDATLTTALLEHTRGNPFFVEEVTRSLKERGALARQNGHWATLGDWDSGHVPVTVEGVLAARIDALGEGERGTLEVLSVIGRRADLMLARAVAADIDSSLATLSAAGLLEAVEEGRYVSFHHPLTQQVVYSRLLRRRRARLHLDVGEAAETLLGSDDSSVDLLARHFALGEQPAKAFDYALRAADRAERLFANEQAVGYLRQALDLEERATGSRRRRPQLLLRCARLEEVRGAYRPALELYEEALSLGDDVRAAAGRAAALRKLGEYQEALDTVLAARAAHPGLDAEERGLLCLEEGWLRGLMGDAPSAAEVLRSGLEAVGSAHPRVAAELLLLLARTEELLSEYQSAFEHATAARRLLEDLEDLPRLATALRVLGGVQHDVAEDAPEALRESRAILEQALALARRVGNAEEEAAALVNLGQILGDLGMVEEAIRCDRESVAAFTRVSLKAGVACAYCNLAEHLSDAERWDEALDAARRGLEIAREIGNVYWTSGALHGIAAALAAQGRHAEALAHAMESVEVAEAQHHPARVAAGLRLAATIQSRLGDDTAADALLARAAEVDPSGRSTN